MRTPSFSRSSEYVPPVVRPIEFAPERFVMGSPVSNPGFPGVDVYEDQF
ncbi:MAG: hypothetical protein IJU13_06715 [Bacteroidales bacterium]|nr:hypothetical protein [Bacteroidales bacterium]